MGLCLKCNQFNYVKINELNFSEYYSLLISLTGAPIILCLYQRALYAPSKQNIGKRQIATVEDHAYVPVTRAPPLAVAYSTIEFPLGILYHSGIIFLKKDLLS
jgi:hypothetical protein